MKRVKAACLHQIIHFLLKEDLEHDYAERIVREEVSRYKAQLERSSAKYRIISETKQEDGSVVIEIIKQYNSAPIGDFLKETKGKDKEEGR